MAPVRPGDTPAGGGTCATLPFHLLVRFCQPKPHTLQVDKVASGLKHMGSMGSSAPAYAFRRGARAEGTAADCLTVAAALLLLPDEGGSPGLLPEGLHPLVERAAQLIGPGAADGEAAAGLAALQHQAHGYWSGRLAEQPRPQEPSALLAALCTEAGHGNGGSVLPLYCLVLRPVRSCTTCTTAGGTRVWSGSFAVWS